MTGPETPPSLKSGAPGALAVGAGRPGGGDGGGPAFEAGRIAKTSHLHPHALLPKARHHDEVVALLAL